MMALLIVLLIVAACYYVGKITFPPYLDWHSEFIIVILRTMIGGFVLWIIIMILWLLVLLWATLYKAI